MTKKTPRRKSPAPRPTLVSKKPDTPAVEPEAPSAPPDQQPPTDAEVRAAMHKRAQECAAAVQQVCAQFGCTIVPVLDTKKVGDGVGEMQITAQWAVAPRI